MSEELTARLRQRGRASIDFFANIGHGMTTLRSAVEGEINAIVPDPAALPDDLDQRDARMQQSLMGSRTYRVYQAIGEFHSSQHGLVARDAFEEVREEMEPVLKKFDEGASTLEANPEAKAPYYWEGVDFHRTAGGWDEHDYQGFIHADIVHSRLVNKNFPGGIFKQRKMISELPPKDHYDRILDMGCSTGHFTRALAETYPDAEIHGVDLSLKTLQQARRLANSNDWAWHLYQRPAEATGFDDDSFDLVTSYILLHEIPADTIKAVFEEAFRVLKPGGDMIMSDVTRYSDLDKLGVWRADSGAKYGGEPHWRASASLDLGQVARDAGFVDVVAKGFEPMKYPYIVQGRKPA
jgi:SAM-dependent methyltransferase